MTLCTGGPRYHGEVCYEGRDCPACELRDELQSTIDERDERIKSLEGDVAALEDQVGALEDEVRSRE